MSAVGAGAGDTPDWARTVGDDLDVLGPDLFAPFVARRVRRPSIAWLNRRWFREHGVDLDAAGTEREIRRWLLDTFSYINPADEDADGVGEAVATLKADRYGTSTGEQHGGSGRCAVVGRFNVKGVGRTPLVSRRRIARHSSGMVHLSEAIHEAIGAELAGAELPYGAVPVVAIIDIGLSEAADGATRPHRRALMIRPNFIRPGHFERSVFFGRGGSDGSEQVLDAQRVKAAQAALPALAGEQGVPAFLRELCLRDARQLGAAHAHRFWLGIFASSNRAISGALADFGSFRAVANWHAFTTTPPEIFGQEAPGLMATAQSLLFYCGRVHHEVRRELDPERVRAEIGSAVGQGFAAAAADAMGLDVASGAGSAATAALSGYFAYQQDRPVASDDRGAWRAPWLLDALAPGWRRGGSPGRRERDAARAVIGAIRESGADAAQIAAQFNATARWLMPRPAWFQEVLFRSIPSFVRALPNDPARDEALIARFIGRQLSRSRRVWSGLPRDMVVLGQYVGNPASVLFGCDARTGETGVWLSGDARTTPATPVAAAASSARTAAASRGAWVCNRQVDTHCSRAWRAYIRTARTDAYWYPLPIQTSHERIKGDRV